MNLAKVKLPNKGTIENLMAWEVITSIVGGILILLLYANIYVGILFAVALIAISAKYGRGIKSFHLSAGVTAASFFFCAMASEITSAEPSWLAAVCLLVACLISAGGAVANGYEYAERNGLPKWQVYGSMIAQAAAIMIVILAAF